MTKKPLFWVVVCFGLFNLSLLVFSKIIMNQVTNRVIERLQKEYSPSPYGPGFDPDKFRAQNSGGIPVSFGNDNWEKEWEQMRGFSN